MEAMAVEHLLLRAWEFEGFWGRTRQRVPVARDNWPELDVVAVRHRDGKTVLRIGEVKVQQGPRHVWVMDDNIHDVLTAHSGDATAWLGSWGDFMGAVCALFPDKSGRCALPGLPTWDELDEIEIVFMFNGWELPDTRAVDRLSVALREHLAKTWDYTQRNPRALAHVTCRVESTLDLMASLVTHTRRAIDEGRGARFGDPFLDGVREMLRYLHPVLSHVPVRDGERIASRKQSSVDEVRRHAAKKLLDAFGIDANVLKK